jgi:predicted transposase YbfD/YdcC
MGQSISKAFGGLKDPRERGGRRHSLPAMITIAICAVICGSEGWVDIAEFGQAKAEWFESFLDLPHGIPSHDTFGRVFALLKPKAFEQCFRRWVKGLVKASHGRLIAVDGKTLRRSFDAAAGRAAIHMVSAFASANRLVFGQIATAAKSNEITAIPQLLKLLDLKDAIITIDAMGCQKAIAQQIIAQGGHYVLAVKDNQQTLHAKIKVLLDEAIALNFQGMEGDRFDQVNKGHGRIERRTCWCTPEVQQLKGLGGWIGLASAVVVDDSRTLGGTTTTARRYFISSLPGDDAQTAAQAIRGHWGVENPLHWILDVAFKEDCSRVRIGHGAENLSRLRRIALNMLQRETTRRISIRAKRLRAGWDHDYLLTILQT